MMLIEIEIKESKENENGNDEFKKHKEYHFYILLSYFQYTNDLYLVVVDLVMKVEQFLT
jgi:hypothetical protein